MWPCFGIGPFFLFPALFRFLYGIQKFAQRGILAPLKETHFTRREVIEIDPPEAEPLQVDDLGIE